MRRKSIWKALAVTTGLLVFGGLLAAGSILGNGHDVRSEERPEGKLVGACYNQTEMPVAYARVGCTQDKPKADCDNGGKYAPNKTCASLGFGIRCKNLSSGVMYFKTKAQCAAYMKGDEEE